MDTCSVLSTLLSTIVGALVGALVTWFVAKHYYVEAGKELKSEANKLRSLTKFLGYKLDENGVIELPKDENGKATYNQKIEPNSIPSRGAVGTPTITVNDEKDV